MDIARARNDIAYFARVLVGEPLWPHQLQLAVSLARFRTACSGRRAGKSRTLAIIALWEAFRAPDRLILLISAGETASRDLLGLCARLADSPLLAGSKLDETAAQLVLSNGSRIRSVPASERQIRGQGAHLLVIDEGCFVSEEIWTAAKYVILATPGSKVIAASTPYGRLDSWFSVLYRAGLAGTEGHESFHWPSHASPMVDTALLDLWRETTSRREYEAEVEAVWADDEGAFFPAELVESAIEDYDLLAPSGASGLPAVGGLDWGKRRDASALVLLSAHPDRPGGWFIPWLVEKFKTPYSTFIDEYVVPAARGFHLDELQAELNGVGDGVVETLVERLGKAGITVPVTGIHTSNRSKQDAYGQLLLWLEQGLLSLPRHPELLKQLLATTFTTSDAGAVSIEVPERLGHDDLADALSFAVAAARTGLSRRRMREKRAKAASLAPGGGSRLSRWGGVDRPGSGGDGIPPGAGPPKWNY